MLAQKEAEAVVKSFAVSASTFSRKECHFQNCFLVVCIGGVTAIVHKALMAVNHFTKSCREETGKSRQAG